MVLLHSTGLGVPLLVILELPLHLVEVHVEVVTESTSGTEMGVDAGIVTTTKTGTSFVLGVIEFLVEVRDVGVLKAARLHAVLKHNAFGSFLV